MAKETIEGLSQLPLEQLENRQNLAKEKITKKEGKPMANLDKVSKNVTRVANSSQNTLNKRFPSLVPSSEPEDQVFDIITLSLLETAEYYKINKEQAKRIFNWSLITMVMGFIALWAGLVFFYFGNSTSLTLAIIASTPAIFLEIIGGLFFALHNKIIKQYNELHEKLSVVQDTMLSIGIAKNIEDPEVKIEAEILLINELMNRNKK